MYQIALLITAKLGGYSGSIDWTQVATVVIAGVGIVLGVLIVLIAIFSGFGALVSKLEGFAKKMKEKRETRKAKRKEKRKAKKGTEKPVENTVAAKKTPAPIVKAAPIPSPVPVVEQGISSEIVAAITAAITASEGSNQFVIRSVKRKDVGSRNPWARAAVSDNTRSF